jgi:hypothetical protein
MVTDSYNVNKTIDFYNYQYMYSSSIPPISCHATRSITPRPAAPYRHARHAMSRHATPRHATSRQATPRSIIAAPPRRVAPCHVAPCRAKYAPRAPARHKRHAMVMARYAATRHAMASHTTQKMSRRCGENSDRSRNFQFLIAKITGSGPRPGGPC